MISMNERGRPAVTVVAATLSGLLVWAIAVPVADVELMVRSGASDQQIGPGNVAGAAIIAGLAAAGLAVLLARTLARPRRAWLIICAAVLLVSLIGPLSAETASAGAALVAMHLAVGATLILGIGGTLARTAPHPTGLEWSDPEAAGPATPGPAEMGPNWAGPSTRKAGER
jgi:hypothetical protein